MVFKCPVCGKLPEPKNDLDFAIELYENALDWPKNGEQIPFGKFYDRLGTVPQVAGR